MNKREIKFGSLDRIFNEIEYYDDWLRKHQYSEGENYLGLKWKVLSLKEIDNRLQSEMRNSRIDEHIQELVSLLNKFIKGKAINCKYCLKPIPLENLLSKPSRTYCSQCALKMLYVQYPFLKDHQKKQQ